MYFNVLANGLPYLLGTERLKGSHSMSGYHSFELCYLAAVYTNLLVRKQPLDLFFKPQPGAFPDNILRVQPDILPSGSVRLQAVWINDERWTDFDSAAMTVKLPTTTNGVAGGHAPGHQPPWTGSTRRPHQASSDELRVRVRVVPASLTYGMRLNLNDGVAELFLDGVIDDEAEVLLKGYLSRIVAARPTRLVLRVEDIESISRTSARTLAFACQGIDVNTDMFVVGPSDAVKRVLQGVGFLEQAEVVADASQLSPAAVVAVGPDNGAAVRR